MVVYLPSVTHNRDFLLIFTAFSKHAKIEHATATIIKLYDDKCIINNIRYLFSALNCKESVIKKKKTVRVIEYH